MAWVFLNIATSMLVAAIIVWKLYAWPDFFNELERAGMVGIATGAVLRIGPLVSKNLMNMASPFDDWATFMFNVGLAVYFIGRMMRRVQEDRDLAKRP